MIRYIRSNIVWERAFMRSILPISAILLTSCAAAAPPPETSACAATAEPWRDARDLASGRDAAGAGDARFAAGEAVRLSLHPDGEVAYRTLPQGAGEAASFGGMASVTIEQAGLYRVGLSEPVWVDVVRDGKPAETVRFGAGPACSGIRKAVSFVLQPGPHTVEISGGTIAKVGVIVERMP
jgi:hypothetical protein